MTITVSRRGPSTPVSSAVLLSLLLLPVIRATTAAAQEVDEDLMNASPLTVAQCRAGCLHKLLPRDVEATECEKKSYCWKCWKYCEVLQTEGKNMKNICEHNCDAGCQEACSFHDWHGGSQPSPVVEARGERALTIDAGTLRWPRPAAAGAPSPSSPRLVYVIMRRREPGTRRTWSQLGQTPGYKARLPKTTAPCTVRVLAVSAEGLVTIYSPAPDAAAVRAPAAAPLTAAPPPGQPPSPPSSSQPQSSPTAAAATLHDLRDADVIIRSLGRDQILGIRLPLAARSAPQEESLRLMGDDPSDSSEVWNLREVSMIHQKVLVIAEVAWDARQVRRPAYLVTWEISGGGLKGNLFTDTTCVTLSLWPDTAYLIQVSLLGGADESVKMSTSPTLLLDTRSAVHSTDAATAAPTVAVAGPDYWNDGGDVGGGGGIVDDGDDDDDDDDDMDDGPVLITREWVEKQEQKQKQQQQQQQQKTVAAAVSGRRDQAVATDGESDVTAELSAPVAVAAGLGHAEWQLLAAAGAGVAVFLLLALVLLAYRSAGRGSPGLHKVVGRDDAECPPLLDYYAPRPLDFTKYLGRCRRTHQLLDEDVAPVHQQQPRAVSHVRH